QALEHLSPQPRARALREIEPLAADDVGREVLRLRDPQLLRPEERLDEDDAPDREVLVPLDAAPLQRRDALTQIVQRRGAVLPAERVPRHADRQVHVVLEEAAAR